MTLNIGAIVKTDAGRRLRVDGLAGVGGQGEAYSTTEQSSGQKGVLKVISSAFDRDLSRRRIAHLVNQRLDRACPVLKAPIDLVTNNKKWVGHYALFAPGESLEHFLANPTGGFVEQLQFAVSLAHAVSVLHYRQIAHGDLHADNVLVNKVGSVYELFLIDFDNYNAPGVPTPPCVGHNLYMAPELRIAIIRGQPAIPDQLTDLYSLGVLMHEIILYLHPASGADGDEAQFQQAMCSGMWVHDPAAAVRPSGVGGYPAEVLNADLARLFRRSISLDRSERPSSARWEVELVKALNQVYVCTNCNGPCVIDASKTSCPLCRQPYPCLRLVTIGGRTISLGAGAVSVGRDVLGGSPMISSRHVVFRRLGPETWIESLGRNGTFRWAQSNWIRLPDNKTILIQRGDRLRFADVDALVV